MAAFTIRPAEAEDLNFIYDSFLKSMKYDSNLGKNCRDRIFFKEFPKVIDSILSRSTTLMAIGNDAPYPILAYLIYEGRTAHYAFTKELMRKEGICATLLTHAFGDKRDFFISHKTNTLKPLLLRESFKEVTFNPFINYERGIKPDSDIEEEHKNAIATA